MMNPVIVRKYRELPLNMGEILRYMGCPEESPQIAELIEQCLAELPQSPVYHVCYRVFDIDGFYKEGGNDRLPFGSLGLAKNLDGCSYVLMFAATAGIEIDRLIAKYSRLSPSKALCFQAIGAERIESLCDAFNRTVADGCLEQGFAARPRFSPGYGDFELSAQQKFFDLLDCHRKIGLSLNDSLLMSPSKSVTAVIGIAPGIGSHRPDVCGNGPGIGGHKGHGQQSSCAACDKIDCAFRKE